MNRSHPFPLLYSPAGLKEIIIYSGGHPWTFPPLSGVKKNCIFDTVLQESILSASKELQNQLLINAQLLHGDANLVSFWIKFLCVNCVLCMKSTTIEQETVNKWFCVNFLITFFYALCSTDTHKNHNNLKYLTKKIGFWSIFYEIFDNCC